MEWSDRQFLEETAREATRIGQTAEDLDNLTRARLFDVLLWAAELRKKIRRSPRKAVRIPIRLQSEMSLGPWQEETETQFLSRYGAQLECQYPVKAGETLQVVRMDTAQQTEARVVWRRHKGAGRFVVGLEFTSPVNFWDWL